jgi:hypothetical protein
MLIPKGDGGAHWFLVHSKHLQERKALQALEGRGITAYCPMVLEPRFSPYAPHGPVPMFPGYVFARMALGSSFAAAHYCPGTAGLVRLGERFAAVDDEVVDQLKAKEADRGYVVLDIVPRQLREGTRVRVTRGVLRGLEGIVSRYVPARRRVRMLLGLAYGFRAAEVDAADVRCN